MLPSTLKYLYSIYLTLYVQSCTPDDGRKDHPKHVEWYSINWKKIVHLVGFTMKIYHDARSHERWIQYSFLFWLQLKKYRFFYALRESFLNLFEHFYAYKRHVWSQFSDIMFGHNLPKLFLSGSFFMLLYLYCKLQTTLRIYDLI